MKELVINKEDLRHNINQIKQYAKQNSDKEYTIIGVVKGNGYGLGLKKYAEFLVDNGIDYLAVSTIDEACCLAESKICSNILMLSPISDEIEAETAVNNNIIVTIDSEESANVFNELAKNGHNIRAHIKIDTGFGRYGFLYNSTEKIISTIKSLDSNINIEGIFSHFSNAYYKKNKHTIKQYERFKNVLEELEKNDINIKLKHICNSPAFLNYPEMHLNCARIGSAFVGRVCADVNIGLKKIGKLAVTVSEIRNIPKGFNISYGNAYKTKKETKLAILQIGYLEGYNVGKRNDMFRFIDKLRNIAGDVKSLFKKQELTLEINDKRYNVLGTIRNVSCYS